LAFGQQLLLVLEKGKKKLSQTLKIWLNYCGTPEGIRTPDLLVRSQTLYPTELPAQMHYIFNA
jgi:hypothetical protein